MRLHAFASPHANGLLFDNKMLGDLTSKGANPREAMAACRELVRSFEQGGVEPRTVEVEWRCHLAWALAANGLAAEAAEQVRRAQEAERSWSAAERATVAAANGLRLLSLTATALPTKLELAPWAREQAASDLRRARTELAELRCRQIRFEDSETGKLSQFTYSEVSKFLSNLDALDARCADIQKERDWEQRVRALAATRPASWKAWRDVEDDLRSQPGIVFGASLKLDLVPIGKNSAGLWEFYDLRSGWDGQSPLESIALPERDANGKLVPTGQTGVVFVLLPRGTFQADGADATTSVDAFLIAEHELTQGQWSRMWRGDPARRRPSQLAAGTYDWEAPEEFFTDAHPVDSVDWLSCRAMLLDNSMRLPTEAEWEYACRAGSTGPWAFSEQELGTACNIADQRASGRWGLDPNKLATWDDGHRMPAPVGSYRSNAWGLHDMHGNVFEWCEANYGPDSKDKPVRGGSYDSLPEDCRSSVRKLDDAGGRKMSIGVRAARSLRDS